MSLSFTRGWEKVDHVECNLVGSQSGHGGGRGPDRCASRLNQGGGLQWRRGVGDRRQRKSLHRWEAVEEPSSSGGGGEEGKELSTLRSWWRQRGSGAVEGEDE